MLDCHSTGHFTHGGQQRQGSVRFLNGFISDADRLAFNERLSLALVRRQMEIGENDLPFPDQIVFGGQRFFDMHDHVGSLKYFRRCVHDLRTRFGVSGIIKPAADAGPFFHQQGMPIGDHDFDAGRCHAYPIFLCLYFL